MFQGRISGARPVLTAPGFELTIAFYEEPSFKIVRWATHRLIAEADAVEVHFWKYPKPKSAEATNSPLETRDLNAHAEGSRRGLMIAPPRNRNWGMRDFYMPDPGGNRLRVGEIIT